MFMTFYNVDMEKAKNINDLLEEYERMEAIIDLFFKKDVENKELEELRRWLTVSINYFRRFQKVLSILKIKDEKINIKEAEKEEKRVINKIEEYKEAKTLEEYLEQLREGIV